MLRTIVYLVGTMATLSMSMSIHEEPMDFSNHKLIRIHPRSTEHVKQLNRLEKEFQVRNK